MHKETNLNTTIVIRIKQEREKIIEHHQFNEGWHIKQILASVNYLFSSEIPFTSISQEQLYDIKSIREII